MLDGLSTRYSISLSENPLWSFLTVTSIGTNHKGGESEDAIFLTAHHNVVIAVISDGVSDPQCAKSGEGARFSVQHTARAIARGLDAGLDTEQAISEAFSHTHNTLVERTRRENASWATYGCTLGAAIIRDSAITIGHIGDSSCFYYDGKRLTRVATALADKNPLLIIHPTWRTQFTVQTVNKPYVKAFVLATDGNESFFLGRSENDGSYTNQKVAEFFHILCTNGTDDFEVCRGVNNLLKETSYDRSDDRTMFWAFRKEKVA